MRDRLEERACDLAVYMIENRSTVRAAARAFGISKSTVHKDAGAIIGIGIFPRLTAAAGARSVHFEQIFAVFSGISPACQCFWIISC